MNRKIVSIGEFMLEMSGGEADRYRLGFAGDTLNTAWYMRAALGKEWDVDYLSALGDDIYSARMREFLEQHHIGTGHIQTIRGKLPGLYLIHQAEGDRQFTYWRDNSAARQLADNPGKLAAALADCELAYFSGITLAILSRQARENLFFALGQARKAGTRVAFDPNIRPALWPTPAAIRKAIIAAAPVIDIALPTFDDDAQIFGDADPGATVLRYQGLGIDEVAVKNGAEAALIAQGDNLAEVPALTATAVDATGAGDAFNGAYLAARLSGQSIKTSAQVAHRIAAKVIGHPGALVDPALLN